MISIVIPSRTIPNIQKGVRCIQHFEGGTRQDIRIVVVLDGIDIADPNLPVGKNGIGITYVLGRQPFVFSRNVNIGAAVHPESDLVIMNDDALLTVPGGITEMCEAMRRPENLKFGVISSKVFGAACNPRVISGTSSIVSTSMVSDAGPMVPFICVAIRREVWDRVGRLDEQFVDYGFEDDDFCRSCRTHGMRIGCYSGCIVDHGSIPSTFRNAGHCSLEPNRLRYLAKWGNHEGAQ